MITINREELAWAAGFFDGEGTFCLSSAYKDTRYPRLVIGQVERQPLERFHRALNGLGSLQTSKNKATRCGTFYKIQISSFEHVQSAGAMLWSFLSEPKRKQFLHIMQMTRQNKTRPWPKAQRTIYA